MLSKDIYIYFLTSVSHSTLIVYFSTSFTSEVYHFMLLRYIRSACFTLRVLSHTHCLICLFWTMVCLNRCEHSYTLIGCCYLFFFLSRELFKILWQFLVASLKIVQHFVFKTCFIFTNRVQFLLASLVNLANSLSIQILFVQLA